MFKNFIEFIISYFRSIKTVLSVDKIQSSLLFIGVFVQGVMPSITIWISAKAITMVSNLQYIQAHDILIICLLWGSSLLLSNLIEPWVFYWQSNISDLAVHYINRNIINKSNSIKFLNFFDNANYHDDIQILQTQSNNKPINLIVTTIGITRDVIIILSTLTLLYTIFPWISVIVILGTYINSKVFATLQKKTWQESLGRSADSRKMNYITSISIGVQYAKEIRFFKLGTYLLTEYNTIFKKIYGRMQKLRLKQTIWPILPILFTVCCNLIAFVIVINMAVHGKLAIGAIVIFLQTLGQLQQSVTNFGEQAGWLSGHVLFFNKYFNFMDTNYNNLVYKKEVKSKKIDKNNNDTFAIEFKKVCFSYSRDKSLLNNINFTINMGEKVAIVGANGAGKSTLAKLLCGLYLPISGDITINKTSILNSDMEYWRDIISPVFQDFNSYSLSIKENIVMGCTPIDEEKLNNAITQSGVSEFLLQYENGIETLLGKEFGGTDLSKGQWQKIALARALYKDSPIFILDEPTSALDPISEYDLLNKFMETTINKTVIFITHRLNSVVSADKILLLHEGQLLAQGTHKYLMHNNAMYNDMFNKQAQYYLP